MTLISTKHYYTNTIRTSTTSSLSIKHASTTHAEVWCYFLSSPHACTVWLQGLGISTCAEDAFHWCWGNWNTKDFLKQVVQISIAPNSPKVYSKCSNQYSFFYLTRSQSSLSSSSRFTRILIIILCAECRVLENFKDLSLRTGTCKLVLDDKHFPWGQQHSL